MDWLEIATKLLRDNPCLQQGEWAIQTLAMWIRDEGKCVYCGADLLESRWIYAGCSSIDHLLPAHVYEKLQNELSNWVLSCRCCNGTKRRWDPNTIAKVYQQEAQLTDEQRLTLIEAVKQQLKSQTQEKEDRFPGEREVIKRAIAQAHASTASAR